jgi:UDP-N-acetylmuramoyl-tripeptide--D-alanyl-D-alanine ligase
VRFSVEEIERATGGRADPGSDRGPVGSVAIDSRRTEPGGLFVPIVAERDGHGFVAAAVAAGASAYLFEPERLGDRAAPATGIAVADTAVALTALGRAARDRLDGAMVVGITGSVGKTSTKDLLVAAASAGRRTVGNERSLNNELGVPLTLANAPADTEVAVVEMGARGIGHIAELCTVARPGVAVVTAVAGVHTEVFGSIEDVARGKGELVEALPAGGLAVLNGDDPRVSAMAARTSASVLRYGVDTGTRAPDLDVVATDVEIDDDLRPVFTARTPWGAVRVALGVRGEHQVGNALASLTVAVHSGVDLAAAAAAMGGAELSPWRMELRRSTAGAAVLNDAYNANPASMAAALRSLARIPATGRRVAVLGAMAELGPEGPDEHLRIGALAADLGVEVLAVGTDAYGAPGVPDIEAAAGALGSLGAGDAVLVKASRVAGLERLADRLLAG